MKTNVSRKTYLALVVLCCILAAALVLACTVYAAHTVAEGAEDHCDCPICRLFSVLGAAWILLVAVVALVAITVRKESDRARIAHTETPVLLFVKLNC